MGKTNKINWVLILQAWAMAWVVIGHSPVYKMTSAIAQPEYAHILYRVAYSFHMPLFFLVSGYLFHLTRIERPMKWWPMVVDKLKRLGIPYLVFTLVALVIKSYFPDDVNRPTSLSVINYLSAVVDPRHGPLMEMWFVAALIWMFVLQPVWVKILSNPWAEVVTTIVLAALVFIPLPMIEYFCITRSLQMAVYFWLGMLLRKYLDIQKFNEKMGYLTAICICLAGIWLGLVPLGTTLVSPLLGIACSIVLAVLLDKWLPSIFRYFREYTYQIFLMGIFVQILIKILYKRHIIGSYDLAFLLCVITGIYVPVIVCLIAKKINNKYLNLCLGLK